MMTDNTPQDLIPKAKHIEIDMTLSRATLSEKP
jgi:hypothetical protein